MDNKITKERVINHLEYDWFKYLVLIALVLFAIIFSFERVNAERDEEEITFFVSSYSYFSNDYENSVLVSMLTDDYDRKLYGEPILKSVNLNFQSPLGSEFRTLLTLNGLISSDVLIADKSWLFNEDEQVSINGFVQLDDNILSLIGINEEDYEFLRLDEDGYIKEDGNRIYGIKVCDLPKIKSLALFKGTEDNEDIDAYLFVIANRANVNLDGNAQTYFCLKKFFEKYGV